MAKREHLVNSRKIILTSNDNRINLVITRNSPHVSSVGVGWDVNTKEDADKFVDESEFERVRQEFYRLQPFTDIVNLLDEALKNANSKTTTVANRGAARSAPYGRYKV